MVFVYLFVLLRGSGRGIVGGLFLFCTLHFLLKRTCAIEDLCHKKMAVDVCCKGERYVRTILSPLQHTSTAILSSLEERERALGQRSQYVEEGGCRAMALTRW